MERVGRASRTLCSLPDRGVSRDRILCSRSGNLMGGPTDPDFPIRNPSLSRIRFRVLTWERFFLQPVIRVPQEETDGGALQALIVLSEISGDLPRAVRELGFFSGNLAQAVRELGFFPGKLPQGPRELGCFFGVLPRGTWERGNFRRRQPRRPWGPPRFPCKPTRDPPEVAGATRESWRAE